VGLDLNPAGIEFCRRRHQIPGLSFVQGNAENLPFGPESVDAVINVESSHCYPHFDQFLSEVSRVLRPGGVLLYTDVRWRYLCTEWEAALEAAPLRLVSCRDIGAEVVRGIELNSVQMKAVRERLGMIGALVDLPERNSGIYRNLKSGRQLYRMYLLAKPT